MAPTLLTELARDLHSACEQILAFTDAGSPALSYVSPGPPAIDCCEDGVGDGMLVVHVDGLGEEATQPVDTLGSGRRARLNRQNFAIYIITVTRCVPLGENGELADLDHIEAAQAKVGDDAWALWNGLMARVRDGLLFTLCQSFKMVNAVPLPIEGGCAGWRITVQAYLPGYRPEGS